MKKAIALVAVEKTFFNFDTDYSYLIPTNIKEKVQLGVTVKVPFGRGNTLRDGIVVKTDFLEESECEKLKEIATVDKKVLDDELIELALWLKDRCFCTTYDCLKLMLPRKFGEINDKNIKMVQLLVANKESLPKLTPKQSLVMDTLFDVGSCSVNELKEFCSVGDSVIKNLKKYGLIEFYEKEVYRNPYKNADFEVEHNEIVLSKEQQNAFDTYSKMIDNGGGNGLLYGVTGSGKTQVYLKLIDKVIDEGKDAIVLIPEISLTPQTLSIFHKRYGSKVAIFHSGLSIGERNDEFKRADRGEAKIVVGTRSAIFAPLHNIGLIIIDEEQEHTYKSDRTPKYNVKDVARFRCAYNKALMLLTSATPSIESFSLAKSNRYTLCTMNQRYGDSVLPHVITVDMKQEIKSGNHSPISAKLKELIGETLDNKKQVILLINRRGYSTFIACNDCGHVITCPNCSISLTYHSYNNRLSCHYCGYTKKLDNICPECKSENVRYSGYGTQRIEDEISLIFPDARIVRMDADTTSTKFSHDKILNAFAKGEYDILVGTQMIAKGLDFDNVTLVGVVNADNSLYDENYNSAEKCFDLITQVIGRSGRRDDSGIAVIQTINPYNQTLEYAANQDYISFYNDEICMRKLMIYPPYCDIFTALFISQNNILASKCSIEFFEQLKKLNEKYNEKIIVLGPNEAKIQKLNNDYRYRIIIKCKNSKNIRLMFNEILKNIAKINEYKNVTISLDVNPNDLN